MQQNACKANGHGLASGVNNRDPGEIMQGFEFNTVGKIISGFGSALQLAEQLRGLAVKKPLFITDPGLVGIGLVQPVIEALTADDRPYKKAKTLSTAIDILYYNVKQDNIDKDIFKLFLTSGVYLTYAKTYLADKQIDEVDVEKYLAEL